jgi:hypothetical protein
MKKEKILAIIIATILLSSTAISIGALSTVKSADYQNYAYITVEPNPVEVGQSVLADFFLTIPTPTGAAGFDPTRNWNNFKVTITSPSGKVENFGPFTSDATGGAFFSYTPNEVGQYKFDFSFPGQTVAGVNFFGFPVGPFTFGPASATTNLTVQQEPIVGYQTPALPTGYWTRPIYGENRGWDQIGGNWLNTHYNITGPFNPYTTAPNTAHIVWAKVQYMGGVVGGDFGDLNYYQAPTYQSYWGPPLIISGRLYYMEREVPGVGWVGMHCVDIRTGKELWFQDVSVIGSAGAMGGGSPMTLYGQLFDAEGANGHGVEPFLWNLGANWTVFDANSGRLVYTITHPLVATAAFASFPGISGPEVVAGGVDPAGSIIAFYMNGHNNWLLKWNSTKLLLTYAKETTVLSGGALTDSIYLPPYGTKLDWSKGIEWNVTIPDRAGIPGFFTGGWPTSNGDEVFASTGDIVNAWDNITLTAYSVKDGHELWYNDFAGVFVKGSTPYTFFGPVSDGVMTIYDKNTARWWGYDVNTGAKLWGPTKAYENAWDTFICSTAAYGKLYVGTFAGRIYCHDLKTGNLLWTYVLPPSGSDTPYGTYPIYFGSSLGGGITIADGKLYAITGDHSPDSPYWLGGAMYCINASTGEGIYKMSGWWSNTAIADGYAVDHNCYDGTIYSFGKGQTAVSVSAPDTAVSLDQSIVIKGTVMDQSPGTMDYAGNQLNSKGSPAIADEYMTQWMEYLYQQKPEPTNATGVPVTLSVIDANNNFRNIGTTTSDITGAFSLMWKPDIPGKYTLIASFAGSESYWPSSTETSFGVEVAATPAPTAVAQTGLATTSDVMTYMAVGVIAIIIAIAIVGALMLRKRP